MTRWRFAMLTLAMTALAAPAAWAQFSMPTGAVPFARELPVMPQDDVLPASLDTLYQNREDIDQVLVTVDMGAGDDNPQWLMSSTQREVLLDTLLQFMPEKAQPEDLLWPKLKKLDPKYKGLRIMMRTVWGRNLEPIIIYEGKVRGQSGATMASDYGRRLEYWMFGTSRIRRDQMIGAAVLPVITFEQCRLLGQPIVHTRPRQCLLPDNNLLLETAEMPTLKSARITNFDQCLKDGKALIYTFPRRCVAAGGRVFTEPPRVYETPLAGVDSVPLIAPTGMGLPPTEDDGLRLKTQTDGVLGGAMGTPIGSTPVVPAAAVPVTPAATPAATPAPVLIPAQVSPSGV